MNLVRLSIFPYFNHSLCSVKPHPAVISLPVITRGLNAADRSMVADRPAPRNSTKSNRRSYKYFSDDARARLLTAFTKNKYPDNDVKAQLAAELDLTPTQVMNEFFLNKRSRFRLVKTLLTSDRVQVSSWFNNQRYAVRHGRELYSGANVTNSANENESEVKCKP